MKRVFAALGAAAFSAVICAALAGPENLSAPAWCCFAAGCCGLLSAAMGALWETYGTVRLSAPRGRKAFFSGPEGRKLRRAAAAAGAAFLAASLCLFRYRWVYSETIAPGEALEGREIRVRAVVLDYPEERYHKLYYDLKTEKIFLSDRETDLPSLTVRVSSWDAIPCRPYDTVDCTLKIGALSRDGGILSAAGSYWAEGIALRGTLTDPSSLAVIRDVSLPPGEFFVRVRREMSRNFQKLLSGEEASLVRAMVLGERESVSQLTSEDFRTVGASHYLVVSGLHMSALAAFVSRLLRRMVPGRRARILLAAAAVGFYLCLTGFPVSALRAAIMILLVLLAEFLGREADSLNSLGFAVCVICLGNPFSGHSLSFLLSVCAVWGLLQLSPALEEGMLRALERASRLRRFLSPVILPLSLTLGAVAAILPLQLLVFGGVSLIAPAANLLLALPCTALLYSAMAAAALGVVPPAGLSALPAFLAGWAARLVLAMVRFLAGLPGAYLRLDTPEAWLALGLLCCLLLAVKLLALPRPAVCSLVAAAVFLAGCGTASFLSRPRDVVTLAAPEESSCVILIRDGHAAVLSLGGYRTSAALQLLERNNVRTVETLCLPRRDRDAREAAETVLKRFPAETLLLPEDTGLIQELAGSAGRVCRAGEGETFSVLDGVEVTVSRSMERMELTVNGTRVMVESGNAGHGSCQVLFTDRTDTRINSPFTVCQSDDIIEKITAPAALPENAVIPGNGGLYVDLLPDGTVTLRGESRCLNWT